MIILCILLKFFSLILQFIFILLPYVAIILKDKYKYQNKLYMKSVENNKYL